jgi:tRNA/rRNA methyltransferase
MRVNLDNITIVLHRPRIPENIGSTARAMCNMGLKRLSVVAVENYDPECALKLATHAAADVVEHIVFYDQLKDAVAELNYVVGTTARLGGQRTKISSPKIIASNLVSISQNNQVAVLFGPENRGLTNAELRLCHALVNIPTADFSSLNLAQAVMILCYEFFLAGMVEPKDAIPKLASRRQLDGMYEQVKDILIRINYINPENPDYWMNKLRLFFSRLSLRAGEVSIIRGICRQINWYSRKCYLDGKKGVEPYPLQDNSQKE